MNVNVNAVRVDRAGVFRVEHPAHMHLLQALRLLPSRMLHVLVFPTIQFDFSFKSTYFLDFARPLASPLNIFLFLCENVPNSKDSI